MRTNYVRSNPRVQRENDFITVYQQTRYKLPAEFLVQIFKVLDDRDAPEDAGKVKAGILASAALKKSPVSPGGCPGLPGVPG